MTGAPGTLGDLHGGDAGSGGEAFALETLRGFEAMGVRPIVIGGTALRCLGSPVPSIDLDCLITEDEWDRHDVYDFIDARTIRHRAVHADSYLEVNAVEWPNHLWNSDVFYRPDELLRAAGTVEIGGRLAQQELTVRIPEIHALGVMKLKAMRNRGLKLAYLQNPRLLLRLFPHVLEQIKDIPPAFMRRKAGKDLVDLCFLQTIGRLNVSTMLQLAAQMGILAAIAADWPTLPADVVEEAKDLVSRHGLPIDVDASAKELGNRLATFPE